MKESNIHAPGELRRAPTGALDYESDLDLDNEEEYLIPAAGAAGIEEDHVKARFEQDIEDARDLSLKLASLGNEEKRQQQATFVRERHSTWHRTTLDGRNFLHCLAYYDHSTRPQVSLQWLMARAILRLPHLMGVMDKTSRTPLTVALIVGNEVFSHAACRNQKPETMQRFTQPLKAECESHDTDFEVTCLHAALICHFNKEESRESIVKIMCSFVPQEMFTVRDIKNRTPLHIAVEYERCFKTQVGIVKELLLRGPAALNVEIYVSAYSNRTVSVYQYHEQSRKLVKRKLAERKRKKEEKTPAQGILREERKPMLNGVKTDARADPKADAKADPRTDSKSHAPKSERSTMGPPPVPRDKAESVGLEPNRRNLARVYTAVQSADAPRSPQSTQLAVTSKFESLGTTSTQDMIEEELEQAAQEISEQLKLLYLRTQRPDRASRFLHFQDERDKELWFDFGPPKRISMRDFEKHFRHLNFDSALQYVAFPQIELAEENEVPDRRHRGKKDMIFFFQWLKKKNVKHIVKVIVEDLEDPTHSDEAIEEALEHFDVEILDWRRLDIDPLTLAHIGKTLREVHLQWSGRNSVLRSWSESEGLAMIPTLEVISLTQCEGLESDERTRKNLDDFEKRLYKSWPEDRPKPRIIRPRPSAGRLRDRAQPDTQPDDRQESSVDPHKWMQCMEDFASYFRQIRALRDSISDSDPKPVEVALIDDGADITHKDLKYKNCPGKSFHDYQEASSWRVSPYWSSASGHGTLMARLIHRICPSAVIHVIKLNTFAAEGSHKLQIDPDSAVRAIEYATEQGAQIICMSWTIKPPTQLEKKKAFDDAVHTALNDKGVLMFCAASDQSKSADLTYPHASNPNSFRIGAARATGSTVDAVGDVHELSFVFPGHEVVVYDDVHDKGFQKFEAHSGSSVANALATGLAALIIECVRLGVLYTNESKQFDPAIAIRKDDLIKIRGQKQMEYAMASIGTNRNTDNKYIEVWNTFSGVAESLKQCEGARINQLEVIAGLARIFLRKGAR